MPVAGAVREMGVDPQQAVLRFGEGPKAEGAWMGRRLLWLDDEPAFELSHWCGTCPFLFERMEGATRTLSVADLDRRLAAGLDELDESVIVPFAELLPTGRYLPILLSIGPRLVRPLDRGDYFANEQVETWGVVDFWGLPAYPRTAYYRTFEAPVSSEAHLYEFVVPMVPPTWNDMARVARYREMLRNSSTATAVAVSILDVCQPAVERSGDYYAHWAFTHFLLDGHHKIQAAAETGSQLRLLSLLSVDASLAGQESIDSLISVRAGTPSQRTPLNKSQN